jgi:cell division protein FtsA
LLVYVGGVVRFTGAVPVGGDHFTNDLAVGLRTPVPEAEKIKREYAVAMLEMLGHDRPIEIASVGDRPPRTVFARMLADITSARAQELLSLVHDEIRRAGLDTQIPAGFVFTGGGSRLRGLSELAEKTFSLPVRTALPRGISGMNDEVTQPEYSSAVGLVLYGARTRRMAAAKPNGWTGKLKALFAGQT